MKIRTKIVLSFVLLVMFAFMIVGYGNTMLISNEMNANVEQLSKIYVSQLSRNIDIFVDELQRLAGLAYTDATFQQAIKSSNTSASSYQMYKSVQKIQQFLYTLFLYRKDFVSVCLLAENGNMYIQSDNRYIADTVPEQEMAVYYKIFSTILPNFFVLGHHFTSTTGNEEEMKETFTVVQRIKPIPSKEQYLLILNVEYEAFLNILRQEETNQNAIVMLENQEGEILYHSGFQDIPDDIIDIRVDEKEYRIETYSSTTTGWKVIMALSEAQFFRSRQNMFRSMTLLGIFSLLAIFVVYYLITYKVTHPIKKMIRFMRQVEKGDMTVQIPVIGNDELSELSIGFNKMIIKTNDLLNKTVEYERKKKEAEYRILQGQINPHFLYNTLESIRMKCIANHEPEIASAINSLSNLFRMSIDHKEQMVTLEDELLYAAKYIEVINYRFANRFNLRIDVSDEMMKLKVLRFLLQPLVENSISHGFGNLEDGGTIEIRASREMDDLLIEVSDDGQGITADRLMELQRALSQNENSITGVGLQNINDRIRLFFGEQYGLKMWSEAGIGTIVILTMPVMSDDKERTFHVQSNHC